MGTLSKLLGLSQGVVTHVAVAVARVLHLSAVLPVALRLKKPEEKDVDERMVVLHDGDEYVSRVVVETLGEEPTTRDEYIEAVKIETVEPTLEAATPGMKPRGVSYKMPVADEVAEVDNESPVDEASDSPLDSLEPDEEIVELSDEEDVPVPITKAERDTADKQESVPPSGLHVAAFTEKRANRDCISSSIQPLPTTVNGMPYTPTPGGSVVMAPELTDSSSFMREGELAKLKDRQERGKTLESGCLSESASVETNATEATEEDRLRGLLDSLEALDKGEDGEIGRTKAGWTRLEAASTELDAPPVSGGLSGASSQSSLQSSEGEDELRALRAESGTPSFIPDLVSSTSTSVQL